MIRGETGNSGGQQSNNRVKESEIGRMSESCYCYEDSVRHSYREQTPYSDEAVPVSKINFSASTERSLSLILEVREET